jgi:hypothetical protein
MPGSRLTSKHTQEHVSFLGICDPAPRVARPLREILFAQDGSSLDARMTISWVYETNCLCATKRLARGEH